MRPYEPRPEPKVRATLYLSAEVLEQARDAAVHLAGFPARLTLTKLAENALQGRTATLESFVQRGRGFPSPRRRPPRRPSNRRIEVLWLMFALSPRDRRYPQSGRPSVRRRNWQGCARNCCSGSSKTRPGEVSALRS